MPEHHEHNVMDVYGAARENHTHTASDLGGVPTLAQVRELERKVAGLIALAGAERQVPEAVADGNATIERIAGAIRRRAEALAGFDKHRYLVQELLALADEIERSNP